MKADAVARRKRRCPNPQRTGLPRTFARRWDAAPAGLAPPLPIDATRAATDQGIDDDPLSDAQTSNVSSQRMHTRQHLMTHHGWK
jgi:hypothetical protein